MNKYLKYFIFMVILGLIVSLSLSFINELTAPIIEEQKLKKVEQSLLKVDSTNKWVSGENYINISDDEGIDSIYISLNDKNEYQFIAYYIVTKGYSNGNIESLIFINNNKKVAFLVALGVGLATIGTIVVTRGRAARKAQLETETKEEI